MVVTGKGRMLDKLMCAESSNLPNPMDWDHWVFGAEYVHKMFLDLWPSPVSLLTFF
jgi:hypothetical protein